MGVGKNLSDAYKATQKVETTNLLEAIDCCLAASSASSETNIVSPTADSNKLLIALDAGYFTGPELRNTLTFNYDTGRTASVGVLRNLLTFIHQLHKELSSSNRSEAVTLQVFIDGGYFKTLVKVTRGAAVSRDFYFGIVEGLRVGLREAKCLDFNFGSGSLKIEVHQSVGEAEGAAANAVGVAILKGMKAVSVSGDADNTGLCGYSVFLVPKNEGFRVYGAKEALESVGCPPEHFASMALLVGGSDGANRLLNTWRELAEKANSDDSRDVTASSAATTIAPTPSIGVAEKISGATTTVASASSSGVAEKISRPPHADSSRILIPKLGIPNLCLALKKAMEAMIKLPHNSGLLSPAAVLMEALTNHIKIEETSRFVNHLEYVKERFNELNQDGVLAAMLALFERPIVWDGDKLCPALLHPASPCYDISKDIKATGIMDSHLILAAGSDLSSMKQRPT